MCKERIWNQGKAMIVAPVVAKHCAKSGFGIKAKHTSTAPNSTPYCAKSGFGIKAKLGYAKGET